MSKRLQVVLSDHEYEAIRIASERSGQTLSAWVRGVLRTARHAHSAGDQAAKLRALEEASRNNLPTGDIDEMIAEIEAGRRL